MYLKTSTLLCPLTFMMALSSWPARLRVRIVVGLMLQLVKRLGNFRASQSFGIIAATNVTPTLEFSK